MTCSAKLCLHYTCFLGFRSIIDWAVPNKIGFGPVLDQVSRDPATKVILIEIDRLRDPKQFLSACRAAARLRDQRGASRAGIEDAFARTGVLLTETFGEFAAAETLVRVRPTRSDDRGADRRRQTIEITELIAAMGASGSAELPRRPSVPVSPPG